MENKNLIVICGPTASGKTSLAVKTAEFMSENNKLPAAEIISADSRQVYRKMDIGTGKDLSEYSAGSYNIPYHCIDIRNPDEFFTLYDYIYEFNKAFKLIRDKNRIPVLSGGTGLYIESVLKQYKMDLIPPDFKLRKKLESKEKSELEKQLKELNRDLYNQTDLSSSKRIIRGIEKAVYYCSPAADNISSIATDSVKIKINPLVFVTRWKRDELVSRIEKRLNERFEDGMAEEVQMLLDEGISPERMYFLGLEYRYITKYLLKEISLEKMKDKLFTEIRRFSKRQVTYFKGMEKRGIKTIYIDNAEASEVFGIINNNSF